MSVLDPREFAFMTETERYDAFVRAYRADTPEADAALEALYRHEDPLLPLIALQYLEELPEKKAVAAIVSLIERENEVVARAAMKSYVHNHYPGKARLLRQLVLSRVPLACRFALRTLSRAGFTEILPLILRELPERDGAVRAEMMQALRYLPDRRSVPTLLPLAESPDETTRFLAIQVLAELQARTRALPVRFFMKRLTDPSDRVRRTTLEALHRFPTQRVAPIILEAALDRAQPEEARVRAVRALGSFPLKTNVRHLVEMAAAAESNELRLAAEIALRGFPQKMLRDGLLTLLGEGSPEVRRQAAFLMATLVSGDKRCVQALLELWHAAPEGEALMLVDVLRAMAAPEAAQALAAAARKDSALAYPAATALAQMRGMGRGRIALDLVLNESLPDLVRQALLDRFARRGPEPEIHEELRGALCRLLPHANENIRYLAVRALGWYPIEETMPHLLDVLADEETAEIVRVTVLQIVRGLGRDPAPFVAAAAAHPRRSRLVTRSVHVLASQGWSPSSADALIEHLALPPRGLLHDKPASLFAVLVHLLEHGSVPLLRLWPVVGDKERLKLFLRVLAGSLRSPRRSFPALALDALVARMPGTDAATRELFYEVLAADGRNEAAERMAAALLKETDEAARKRGARLLRGILEAVPE